jgi:hypothetical protein
VGMMERFAPAPDSATTLPVVVGPVQTGTFDNGNVEDRTAQSDETFTILYYCTRERISSRSTAYSPDPAQ